MESVTVGAREAVSGSIQTVYAYSYRGKRRVLLFPAYLRPKAVLTRRIAGGATPVDSLHNFAQAIGLNSGITADELQAIILLHEESHLNIATFDDHECLVLSMLNSRRVAEACFPQLIEASSEGIGVLVAKFNPRTPASCGACHANKNQLVKTPKAAGVVNSVRRK